MASHPPVNETRSKHTCLNPMYYIKQTPMRLFEDDKPEQSKISVGTKPAISQNKICNSFSPSTYNMELFAATPPMTQKTISVPDAPMKLRKPFVKLDLKPKKLIYTEKYNDLSQEIDSGISIQSEYLMNSADFQQQETSIQDLLSTSESKGRPNTETMNLMLKNMRLETNNKENRKCSIGKEYYKKKPRNRPVIKEHSTNDTVKPSNPSFSSKCSSTKGLNRYPSILSQCVNTIDWKEKLFWLQSRRDVGMMIQCCRRKCKKWRYTEDYHDPVDVPKYWYCKMNSDNTIASCLIPEIPNSEEVEEDLIENKYNAGSIVWGYIKKYLWWPAIIDDCPTTFRYYELRESSDIPVRYHLTFFMEDTLEHAWLNCRRIKAFTKNKKHVFMKKTTFYGINYKDQLAKAYTMAQNAIPLSILERLQNFSYVSRLRNMQSIISNPRSCNNIKDSNYTFDESTTDMVIESDESSNEIPATQSYHITLKDFNINIRNTMDIS